MRCVTKISTYTEKDRSSGKEKNNSLQIIRAFAILGIMSSHCEVTFLGSWGVSVFFILSGFVHAYVYYDRNINSDLKESVIFSIEKVAKLYPLHILMTIFAVILSVKDLMCHYIFKRVVLYMAQLFFSIFLIQAWFPSILIYFSMNTVSWYLSVTLFIYLVFPLILNKIVKKIKNIKQAFFTFYFYYIFTIDNRILF